MRPFSSAFLAGDPAALALLPALYRSREARLERARQASARPASAEVVAALVEQDAAYPPSRAREASLSALGAGATCVVTGQQTGLFLGPLYTLYKAATAIVAARAIEAESGARCVPIFWLQTEDHDLAEIDHCHVFDRRGGRSVRLGLARSGEASRVSVEHVRLGPEVEALHEELAALLGAEPHADEILPLLRRAYRDREGIAAAFAHVIAAIFSEYGLILLDPRRARIALQTAHAVRTAIERHEEAIAALSRRGEALRAAGFEEQVRVRGDALLPFFHPAGPEGPRHRLTVAADGLRLPGAPPIARESLLAVIAREPLCASTSALLRPLVQDSLLPTVGYVAGPGEINYFAQLPPLYAVFGLPPPLVIPRARVRLVDAHARARLAEVARREADARAEGASLDPSLADRASIERSLLEGFSRRLAELETLAPRAADPELARAARRTRASVERAVARYAARLERARAASDRGASARRAYLDALLVPAGEPQERHYAPASFAARHGLHALVAAAVAAIERAGPFTAPAFDLDPDSAPDRDVDRAPRREAVASAQPDARDERAR